MRHSALTAFCEQFEKKAGLFEVPESSLNVAQKEVMKRFCSIVLTLCALEEGELRTEEAKGQEITFEDRVYLHNIKKIKEVCKTYGAESGKSNLVSGQKIITQVILDKRQDDKSSRLLSSIPDKLVHINIVVNFITDPSARQDISDRFKHQENTWEGLFTREGIFIFIDMERIKEGLNDVQFFLNYLNNIRTTIRHELQHSLQFAIHDLSEKRFTPGLPSKNIQNGSVKKQDQGSGKEENTSHSLIDIEFYTDLKDAIEDFKFLLSNLNLLIAQSNLFLNNQVNALSRNGIHSNLMEKVAPEIKQVFLKVFMGEIEKKNAKRIIENILATKVMKPLMLDKSIAKAIYPLLLQDHPENKFINITTFPAVFINNDFLPTLRKHNIGKYKKAINEFYKSVSFSL